MVLSQGLKGRYKHSLTSLDFIGLWKEKRYRRNMMFLFAGHSAGLLSKNFVKQSFTKFLESQLHGSRRKSYLSVPFFFYLRYGWLVRGRLYMPIYAVNCTTESAIYVMELWLALITAACNLDSRIFTTGILHAAQPWINKKLNWFVFRILGAAGS